jgi:hypothetical protein
VTQWEFDQLADLSHLLAASSNVIISDVSKVGLFILTLDRLAFAVDDGILSDLSFMEKVKGAVKERAKDQIKLCDRKAQIPGLSRLIIHPM